MSANEDFFRERRAQAVFKHGILSRYPVIFASKTGWGGRPVVFLDGYAGRGEYEDGFPGSPVLLAETATKVASFRGVTGIYVEKDRADFLNLQRVMAKYNRSNDQILCGDLRDHLSKILNDIPGAALFAFLDPFGTALDREQIAGPLLGRHGTAPVEVLLHMSIGTVARLGGLLRRRRQQGVELSVADEKSIDHVDRFLGGTWWWQHFEPVDAADQPLATSAALQVASDYQTSICSETGCRSVSMPIRRQPNQLPKYVLVLFTFHGDGLWYFADSVGQAGRDWQGAWRMDASNKQLAKAQAKYLEPGLFNLEEVLRPEPFDTIEYERQHRDQWQQIIQGNIVRLLESDGPFVLGGRVDQVYGTLLGAASERHVRAAVKALHDDRIVENTGVGKYFFREQIRPSRSTHRSD